MPFLAVTDDVATLAVSGIVEQPIHKVLPSGLNATLLFSLELEMFLQIISGCIM
jgi:hypothetical protein